MIRFNDKNEIIQEEAYRGILVGVQLNKDISYYMKELWGLSEAAGIEVIGEMVQNLEKPNTVSYIGKGKVDELLEMCENMQADVVVFNDELSGIQFRNLEEQLGVRVIDRTVLILDIFASRATSREGKLQVELAQLQYRLPRLTGFGKSLSRLGGGIGTRGPGEKKLETDRRHINKRMDDIKREIQEVKNTRNTQRAKRERTEIPVVALVGYTNSGKSALMNRLLSQSKKEDKTVFEKNMLFATLDTSQRSIQLESNQQFILVDTVGFVSKLPHTLVNAFKATLEEVNYADLLLHIVDSSYEDNDFHVDVTNHVLKEIGAGNKEKLLVYNKIDLVENRLQLPLVGEQAVYISAKTGEGMDELIQQIKGRIFSDRRLVKLQIPYDRGDLSSYLCEKVKPQKMEYKEDGTYFEAELSLEDQNRFRDYQIEAE
ncbi:GTPase HflX [Sinanaerobacter sp. ZZT-01]|uniref:GTPase HflX n=1 Tax=Sinanaerobacter sp. ZZT-01 TaxID=3111540 RepID=UPI002D7985B7|nr:GTPase HflX [Sinanaerobacter sp. ZZT-01]WRR92771.1 GTPase HflX [Sinanaerobacter sp. ZZT-01]